MPAWLTVLLVCVLIGSVIASAAMSDPVVTGLFDKSGGKITGWMEAARVAFIISLSFMLLGAIGSLFWTKQQCVKKLKKSERDAMTVGPPTNRITEPVPYSYTQRRSVGPQLPPPPLESVYSQWPQQQ